MTTLNDPSGTVSADTPPPVSLPSASSQTHAAPINPQVGKRAVIAASVGNAMEWYDFSVYAFFASYIAVNFFAKGDTTAGLVSAFLVYGVGFIARPLGAVILGAFGDKYGRGRCLNLTIAIMGIGTLIIALAPQHTVIGLGAPLLLMAGRLLQGFSAGGEFGSAAAYLLEHAPENRKSAYASWLQASMGVSNILAALMGTIITTLFSESQLQSWAWRIPFLFGALVIVVGLYIRRSLPEPADYQPTEAPISTVWRNHRRGLVAGVAYCALWTVSVYALIIYLPTYYRSAAAGLGFTSQQAFIASLLGNVFMVAGCVLIGRVKDRFDLGSLLRVSVAVLVIVPPIGIAIIHASPTMVTLILVHSLMCASVALFAGAAPSIISSVFPVSVRSTGISLSYNFASIAFGGFAPAIMAKTTTITVYAPALYVLVSAVITAVGLPLLLSQIKRVAAQS